MTRSAIAAILIMLALAGAAHAFGLGLGNRFGKLGSFGQGSGGSPPPTCSNKLDFSQPCNSQYLILGPLL